jgi:hypothetical protein
MPEERRESDDYPALRTLVCAYFNQDWDIIYKTEDPDEVIVIVREQGSPEAIQSIIQDIERLLAKYGQNDTELTAALRRTFKPDFAFYNMKDRGTREGLEKVIEILSNPPNTS